MDFTDCPLVETDWLEKHLDEPDLRVVDARWRGDGTGSRAYRTAHIPGAVYLSWDTDLTHTVQQIRWVILPPERFATVIGRAGISDQSRVVVYAETDDSGAARLWWALRYYGHDQVAILNGGLGKWLAEQRLVNQDVVEPVPAYFTPVPRPEWLATAAEIDEILNDPEADAVLVDTRPPEQYAGQAVWTPLGSRYLPPGQDWVEVGGRAMRGGRIPGAVSRHAVLNLDPDDNYCFRRPEMLHEQLVAAGIRPDQRVITYCGCGVSASLGLSALYVAGFRNLALYDASWEEWGTNPALRVERD